jgi:uncharacterized protein YdeI (YjbR/CyaY-like superfamily)
MEMAYRERWEAEIAEMRRVLAGFAMKEECKWGKPTYTVDGKNIVIMLGLLAEGAPVDPVAGVCHAAAIDDDGPAGAG